MDTTLIYVTGPILAFGLPLAVVLAGLVRGFRVSLTTNSITRVVGTLVVYSAMSVPSHTPITSSNDWITVWWVAAARGNFEFSFTLFLYIAAASLVGLFAIVGVRMGIETVRKTR